MGPIVFASIHASILGGGRVVQGFRILDGLRGFGLRAAVVGILSSGCTLGMGFRVMGPIRLRLLLLSGCSQMVTSIVSFHGNLGTSVFLKDEVRKCHAQDPGPEHDAFLLKLRVAA